MSCKAERKMNYERMLISPVVPMSYSVYVNVLQQLSLHCRQLQGAEKLGRVEQRCWWSVCCAGTVPHGAECAMLVLFQHRQGKDVSWARWVLGVNGPKGLGRCGTWTVTSLSLPFCHTCKIPDTSQSPWKCDQHQEWMLPCCMLLLSKHLIDLFLTAPACKVSAVGLPLFDLYVHYWGQWDSASGQIFSNLFIRFTIIRVISA